MKNILNFNDYINESYLKGGRQPLYHFTSSYHLEKILESDLLRPSKPVKKTHGHEKSISLTRFIGYKDTLGLLIKLNYDKLLNNGYRSYPIDEVGWTGVKRKKKVNFNKSNFNTIKSGKKGTAHNLNLPKEPIMETEFEERIYKPIQKLGKYIIDIYILSSYENRMKHSLKKFLIKYPHIKIYSNKEGDYENNHNNIDITDWITKPISKPVLI